MIRLITLIVLIVFSFLLVTVLEHKPIIAQTCGCVFGAVENQGDGAFGCPSGTDRICTCYSQLEYGGCFLPPDTPVHIGRWGCECIDNGSGGGGSGSPGGSGGSGDNTSAQCPNGGFWVPVDDPNNSAYPGYCYTGGGGSTGGTPQPSCPSSSTQVIVNRDNATNWDQYFNADNTCKTNSICYEGNKFFCRERTDLPADSQFRFQYDCSIPDACSYLTCDTNLSQCVRQETDQDIRNQVGIGDTECDGKIDGDDCIVCTAQIANPPLISAPVNGTIFDTNSVTVAWEQNGSWGEGCPTIRNYRVFVDKGCTGNFVNYTTANGGLGATQTSYTLSSLEWGETYCVKVKKHNGSTTSASPEVRFTVNRPPTIASHSITSSGQCTYDASGRIHQESPDVNNPVTFNLEYEDAEGDEIRFIGILLLPTTGPNADGSDTVQSAIAHGKANRAESIGVRVKTSDGEIQILQSDGTYKIATADEIINDFRTATVIRSGTTASVNRNNAEVAIQIRFENIFYTGEYDIYGYAQSHNNDGTIITSGATTTYNIGYELLKNGNNKATWEVDTQLPIIGMTIPIYTDTDTFNLLYRASDSESGLKSNSVKVVVSSDTPGTSITDQTTGQTINMPLANTEYDAGINVNNLGRHTYTVNSTGNPTLLFTLSGEDNACNRSDAKALARVPDAWIMGINGMISTLEGVINMNIPNNTPVDISNEAGYNDLAYLGTEEIISGTGFLPDDYISKTDKYIRRYEDNASSTPPNSSYRNWYEHLKDRLEKNLERDDALKETTQIELSGENILNSNNTISTNLTNISGDTVNPGEPVVVFIDDDMLRDGSLTVGRNNICDVQGMFLVNGNITITPNFTNATNTDGCIFISANDLQINKGSRKTSGVLNDGNRSNYDTIEALLIADGTLNFILDDDSNPADHWDGLHIDGGAVGISYQNDRDLNIDNNVNQPATIFEYDPRYRHLFEEFFKFRGYSIRETSLRRGN